jgi:hypothetical protein
MPYSTNESSWSQVNNLELNLLDRKPTASLHPIASACNGFWRFSWLASGLVGGNLCLPCWFFPSVNRLSATFLINESHYSPTRRTKVARCVCVFVCVCVCLCVFVSVCVYAYIYVYVYNDYHISGTGRSHTETQLRRHTRQ